MSKLIVRNALEPVISDWANRVLWDEFTPWDQQTTWQEGANKGVAIAWENVGFRPITDAPWLQVTLIPAETVSGSFCAPEYKGLLHINVFGVSGQGAGLVEYLAESVAGLFPAGFKVNGVRITRPPTVGVGVSDPGGWYMVPVRARYRLN